MSSDFTVKIYGCRGSIPVSGAEFTRYGGATTCVVVRVGDRDIIFDAGSGIVDYARTLTKQADPNANTSYIFLTHTHFDHVIGLPFFSPIYTAKQSIYFFGPRTTGFSSFQNCIETLIRSPYYPVEIHEMSSKKHFHDIGNADVVYFLKDTPAPVLCPPACENRPPAKDILCEVHCLRGLNHPKCGVNIYKVIYDGRSVVFATDTEGYVMGDRRLVNFAQNADILIHDAMYTNKTYADPLYPTQGFGHSTVEISAQIAIECNAKKLILFHHAPGNTDDDIDQIDALGKSLFAESAAAFQGMHISV